MTQDGLDYPLVEWGAAFRAAPGEEWPGDCHLVLSGPWGALAAAIDGIGHGEPATAAAMAAVQVLKEHSRESIIALARRCHEAARLTRGVVMTLASFNADEATVTALGIGNVETVLLRRDPSVEPTTENLLLRAGIVGLQLPPLRASIFQISPGDLMIMATDGIRSGFAAGAAVSEPVQAVANRILAEGFRGTDDGLVLAIRYLGRNHG